MTLSSDTTLRSFFDVGQPSSFFGFGSRCSPFTVAVVLPLILSTNQYFFKKKRAELSGGTMAPSNSYHTGLHDRRGFDAILQFLLASLVASLLILILFSWKLGLGMFLFFGVYYITFESSSAPPENRPEKFIVWARQRPRRRPVLLCLGDSLTHGNMSASFTPEIPVKLSAALGMDPPSGGAFLDPLWVVNAGQVRHCSCRSTFLLDLPSTIIATNDSLPILAERYYHAYDSQ
jgi:hypothetical protein